ncbi:MAG: Asp-tRNA(Asn)/Glu-tRNA(Gln) amidotransferase subunit GatC [Candidatus Paceibacterota bacterium]
MQITDIEKLAELAKIELTEVEKENLLQDLDGILGYVKQIEEVEVPDLILPARNSSGVGDAGGEYKNKNIWREDLPRQDGGRVEFLEFSREEIISQFPDAQDSFVKVKKIL